MTRLTLILLSVFGLTASCGSTESDDGIKSCADTEWCSYTDGQCGLGFECFCQSQRPADCVAEVSKVCGCDGQLYDSACEANQAGVDTDADGTCEVPAGHFRCGDDDPDSSAPNTFCAEGTQFCDVTWTDRPLPSSFNCRDLPAACAGTPDCDCLANELGGTCEVDNDGNFIVELTIGR